jgi:hypothetical protein
LWCMWGDRAVSGRSPTVHDHHAQKPSSSFRLGKPSMLHTFVYLFFEKLLRGACTSFRPHTHTFLCYTPARGPLTRTVTSYSHSAGDTRHLLVRCEPPAPRARPAGTPTHPARPPIPAPQTVDVRRCRGGLEALRTSPCYAVSQQQRRFCLWRKRRRSWTVGYTRVMRQWGSCCGACGAIVPFPVVRPQCTIIHPPDEVGVCCAV